MGVLNVTPDSFSDGGRFVSVSGAAAHARAMRAAGASVIDVGGESTRPGAMPVDDAEQIRRVVPVIRQIAGEMLVSIDTTRAAVARAAIEAGAKMINDVSAGLADPAMLATAAGAGVPVALMHRLGPSATMQSTPAYDDVVAEVRAFLAGRVQAAVAAGVLRHRVLVDCGIGFGKMLAHNLSLLKHHRQFADLGGATLLGTSRKSFIGQALSIADPADRLIGTAASIAWGALNGGHLLRVHDVLEMKQVVALISAIQEAS